MPKRERPEEKPQKQSVPPPKQGVDEAARERARKEFRKMFPNARKALTPQSRNSYK